MKHYRYVPRPEKRQEQISRTEPPGQLDNPFLNPLSMDWQPHGRQRREDTVQLENGVVRRRVTE